MALSSVYVVLTVATALADSKGAVSPSLERFPIFYRAIGLIVLGVWTWGLNVQYLAAHGIHMGVLLQAEGRVAVLQLRRTDCRTGRWDVLSTHVTPRPPWAWAIRRAPLTGRCTTWPRCSQPSTAATSSYTRCLATRCRPCSSRASCTCPSWPFCCCRLTPLLVTCASPS